MAAITSFKALAQAALGDPMVGPAEDRARRIAREVRALGAKAVVVSRIPGASHCALEGEVIADILSSGRGVPVIEIEAPALIDAVAPALRTRLEALIETAKGNRR